jgi:UDP-galactopyranose mutase
LNTFDGIAWSAEAAIEQAVEYANGDRYTHRVASLGGDERLSVVMSVEQWRELAEKLATNRNLRHLVQAMIGGAVKDALK